MRKSVDRALRICLIICTFSGFLALVTTNIFGVEILIVPIVLLGLSPICERIDQRTPRYRHVTSSITMLFTLSLPVLFLVVGLLETVIALIVFIQAHKILHVRNRRDYYHAFLMAFFMLICACSLMPDSSIAVVLALFGASAIWGFMLLHVKGELEHTRDDTPPEIVDPGIEQVDYSAPAPRIWGHGYLRWGVVVGMGCLIVISGVFLVTPRIEAGFLQRESMQVSVTGVNDQVELSQGGPILPDSSVVMHVVFPDSPDGQYHGPMYWRSTTYHGFYRTRWERAPLQGAVADDYPSSRFEASSRNRLVRSRNNSTPLVRQSIELLAPQRAGLPTLANPVEVRTDADVGISWEAGRSMGVLLLDQQPCLTYEVLSEPPRKDPDELRQVTDLNRYRWVFDQEDYRLLTYHHLDSRVLQIIEELTMDADNVYDMARAIESWLSSDAFVYSMDPPPLNRARFPINTFIMQTRAGHCELFASAMALMLRSQGIPARVVGGYRGGEWQENGGYYIVRNSMAHLWVEAYFLDHGWVAFDPSPSPEDIQRQTPWYQGLVNLSLRARYFWYRNVVGYRGGLSWAALREFTASIFDRLSHARLDGIAGLPRAGQWLGGKGILVVVAIGIGLSVARIVLRQQRRRIHNENGLTPDQKRAVRLLRRFRRFLRRKGIPCEGKTSEELLSTIEAHEGSLFNGVAEQIVQTYNEVRFGQAPMSRQQYSKLLQRVRRVSTPRPS